MKPITGTYRSIVKRIYSANAGVTPVWRRQELLDTVVTPNQAMMTRLPVSHTVHAALLRAPESDKIAFVVVPTGQAALHAETRYATHEI